MLMKCFWNMIIYFVNVVFPVVSSCVVAAVKSAQLSINKCLLLTVWGPIYAITCVWSIQKCPLCSFVYIIWSSPKQEVLIVILVEMFGP